MSSVKLFGRPIPLTKKGLPNLRSLTKDEKDALKSILDSKKKKKQEDIIKELETFFSEKEEPK